MIILGIETSCDETALCLIEASGDLEKPTFKLISEALISQIELHKKYGGVFPMMAKREHAKNLIPLLENLLKESNFLYKSGPSNNKSWKKKEEKIQKILEREPELSGQFLKFIPGIEKPAFDAIAVTYGPGLEPALWVGINFAKALGVIWNMPVIPVNHMEGHIFSALAIKNEFSIDDLRFPILALLISGGHTELVLAKDWLKYKIIGQTKDDAVGEAFDKVARMLELPYPGGPEVSRLATSARENNIKMSDYKLWKTKLPRPMINTPDFDFSFSGLKTAVLYLVKKTALLTPGIRAAIAREFEEAATDVLVEKTRKALLKFEPNTLIIAGGVSANTWIRKSFSVLAADYPDVRLMVPDSNLSTDNAVMIAIAGYIRHLAKTTKKIDRVKATGNLKLS